MYIVNKTFRVEKAHYHTWLNQFKKASPISNFDGFVKREIAIGKTKDDVTIIRISHYFKDKKAYYRWEGSEAHIEMHKQKHPKREGLLDVLIETFDLYQVDERSYEKTIQA